MEFLRNVWEYLGTQMMMLLLFQARQMSLLMLKIETLSQFDVFTSWDDKTRVDNKIKNFEDLWANRTKYVEIYDLVYAEKKNLLKYTTEWAVYR